MSARAQRELKGENLLMMRKIFGGTMLLSITGAIILGGAFAWTNSKTSGEETINIGSVTWNLHYEQEPGVYLGPNDGELRVVGDGWIDNDSHSNFALRITGGGQHRSRAPERLRRCELLRWRRQVSGYGR